MDGFWSGFLFGVAVIVVLAWLLLAWFCHKVE
jgi:hypothetical protein